MYYNIRKYIFYNNFFLFSLNLQKYLADIQLLIIWNLGLQRKNLNIEKIAFKFVQVKFLAKHITDNFFFYIYLH